VWRFWAESTAFLIRIGQGCDLHQFVFANKTDGLLQGERFDGREDDVFVLSGRSHVGELLFLARVDVDVLAPVVFSYDHALVNRVSRHNKKAPPGLKIEQGIRDGISGAVGHDGAGKPAEALPSEILVSCRKGSA
jgi:hypothetical protein